MDAIGSLGGVLIVVCQIPQLRKIIVTKRVDDISLETYVLLFIGQIMWGVYGILKSDLQIILTNIISAVITLAIISLKVYYWKYKPNPFANSHSTHSTPSTPEQQV